MGKSTTTAPAPAPSTTYNYASGTFATSLTVSGNQEALRTVTLANTNKISPKGVLADGTTIAIDSYGSVTMVMGNGGQTVTDYRNGTDTIYTNNGGDTLIDARTLGSGVATKGHTFYGGNGKDVLLDQGTAAAGTYADLFFGNNGADILKAGNGNDELIGGQAGDLNYDGNANTTFGYYTKSTTNSVSDSAYVAGAAVARDVFAPWDVIWDFDVGSDYLDFWNDRTTAGPVSNAATGMSLKAAAATHGGVLTWLGILTTDAAAGTTDATRAFGIWQNDDTSTLGSNAHHQFVYVDIDGDGKADAKIQVNVGLDDTNIIIGHVLPKPNLVLVQDTGFDGGDKVTSNPGVKVTNFLTAPGITYQYSLDGGATWAALTSNTFNVNPNALGDDDGTLQNVKVKISDGVIAVNSNLFNFTLDTHVDAPTVGLDPSTESGAVGDNYTNDPTLLISDPDANEPQTPAGAFTRSYSYELDGNPVGGFGADGVYEVTVTDTDQAGNTASTTYSFTLDQTIADIDASVADSAPAGVPDGDPLLSDGLTNDATLTVSDPDTWDLNDPDSEADRDYYIDFEDGDPDNGTHSDSYTAPTVDGTYHITITDTDKAGNETSETVTFTLDTTLATPTITGDEDGNPVFSGEPGDLYSRVYHVDDGETTTDYDSFPDDLDPGSYTVTVTDTDNAGNTETSDPFDFEVEDDTPPPPPILAGTWVVSNSTDASFSMSGLPAAVAGTVFTCDIAGVNTAQGTVNFNVHQATGTTTIYYTGTDNQAYQIDVIIYDTADQGKDGSLVLDVGAFAGDYDQSYIKGGQAGDDFTGTAAIDLFIGGNGDDVLQGDLSNDTLSGGQGSDTFVYTSTQDALDLITDFNDNGNEHDVLDFSAITAGNAGRISFVTNGDETTVKIDGVAIVVVVVGNASDPLATGVGGNVIA
jgi:hypothetical protein